MAPSRAEDAARTSTSRASSGDGQSPDTSRTLAYGPNMGWREDIARIRELDRQKALAKKQGLDWREEVARKRTLAQSEPAANGQPPARSPGPSADPMGYIVTGSVLQILGGFLLGASLDTEAAVVLVIVSAVVIGIGSIVALIGTIAMGVLVGMRARANESA